MRMSIVPFGGVDTRLVKAIVHRLSALLPWEFEIRPRCDVAMPTEGAVHVDSFFALLRTTDRISDMTIGVASLDLTAPGFDHVFGYAAPEQHAATISLYRLADGTNDTDVLVERAAKEVLHEAGHVLGLGHCGDPRCVMTYSQTLQDTDIKPCYYCAKCLREISRMPETVTEEA